MNNMDDDIAGFEDLSAFDMNSLLADASLHEELRALGWKEEPHRKADSVQTQPTTNPDSLSHPVDLDGLIGHDDLHVSFEESDLNDPDLLKAYEELSTGKTVPAAKPELREEKESVMPMKMTQVQKPSAVQHPVSNELDGMTSAEAKRRACQFKREGNTDEALKWFRYSKQLEATNAAPIKPINKGPSVTTSSKAPSAKAEVSAPLPVSPFLALEEALTQASETALNAAKLLREKEPKVAVEEMREYKRLQQELTVLKARQSHPGARPPLFHWESVQKQEKIEYLELGETDLKLSIKSLSGFESIMKEHSSKTISINFNFGQSASKDGSADFSGSTRQFTYEANKPVDINHDIVLNCIKRGKLAQQTYGRKKINFEIILHRGFFRSNMVLAVATIALLPLLEACECVQELPLLSAEIVDGAVKKGKAVGGVLKAALRVRTPLVKPEVRVTEVRRLVIGPWPNASEFTGVTDVLSKSEEPKPVVKKPTAVALPYEDVLTEKEKNDPEDVEFIESNDVLDSEIARVQQLIASTADEDDRFALSTKLQLLSVKLQILVTRVQSESLSFEEYLNVIRDRMKRDQMMALYQKAKGDPTSLSIAVSLMRRIKIMQTELKNAEESMEDNNTAEPIS